MASRAAGLLRRMRSRTRRMDPKQSVPPPQRPVPEDPFFRLVTDPGSTADPFPVYEEMRARGPMYRGRGARVMATGYDAVSAVLRDDRFQVHRFNDHPELISVGPHAIIRSNPPRHNDLRRFLGKGFAPRHIQRLSELITAQCSRLLDGAFARGEFDAVEDYALPLAVQVIADILGIPESYHARLRVLGNECSRAIDPVLSAEQWERTRTASSEVVGYFSELVAQRVKAPRDDLLSDLAQVMGEEDGLSEIEVLANSMFILLAGYETSVGMIGSGINIFADSPQLWRSLTDAPDRVPTAVEEVLRLESPVQMTQRVAREDLDIVGFPLPAGTPVVAVIAAANRDPDMFADPTRFDLYRKNAARHLAFVVGAHHCLGSALARMEGEIAFRTLLERMPRLERAAPPVRRPHLNARGLLHVPLVVRP